ncbi:MAG: hypothetical protein NXI22_03255 [bacterium]|nr:hypothetical protein [bacterium]
MPRRMLLTVLILATSAAMGNAQELSFGTFEQGHVLPTTAGQFDWLHIDPNSQSTEFQDWIVRGQSGAGESGGDGGGASASAATDPSAILTQMQFQNVFTANTYNASGYSNTAIIQPVLPFPVAAPRLKEFFPNHIIRPTLPIISPTADPDGPLGTQGGLGDLTLLDAYVHPVEGFGSILLGYNAIIPTATHPQLGLSEWQLGPAAAVLYKEMPKTLVGALVTTQFSFQSDAQQVNVSPIFVRHLPKQWYVGWGEIFWTFDTATGNYNMPLNVRVGKIVKVGDQAINVFVEPFYTPEGLRSGPASEWGVKLNVTFLLPEKKFGPLLGPLFSHRCGHCCR